MRILVQQESKEFLQSTTVEIICISSKIHIWVAGINSQVTALLGAHYESKKEMLENKEVLHAVYS